MPVLLPARAACRANNVLIYRPNQVQYRYELRPVQPFAHYVKARVGDAIS